MAKLNEGDVMEGIFAIALAELFAWGTISKTRLNNVRRKVDTSLFRTGRYKTQIRKFRDGKPEDRIEVNLEMRMKYESTRMAFGEEYAPLYDKSGDIGNLDRKIDSLISYTKSNYRRMVDQVKRSYLDNDKEDDVVITIVADGIAGESSGGMIKGDLEVLVDINGVKAMDQRLNFSLKSGSKTLANLSPYNGMMDILKRFGAQVSDEQMYASTLGGTLAQARTPAEKKMKVDLIKQLYNEVLTTLKDQQGTAAFKQQAFKLFRDVTFGDDLADVVDIDKTKVKEMTVDYINELEQKVTNFAVEKKSDNLKFKIMPQNKELFQLRFKNRSATINGEFKIKELKFYIEAGPAAYIPK
tara:strand:- start:1874 stop:2938 length:1065 start_codon:yes stop_codon:yes gene_type:complete